LTKDPEQPRKGRTTARTPFRIPSYSNSRGQQQQIRVLAEPNRQQRRPRKRQSGATEGTRHTAVIRVARGWCAEQVQTTTAPPTTSAPPDYSSTPPATITTASATTRCKGRSPEFGHGNRQRGRRRRLGFVQV